MREEITTGVERACWCGASGAIALTPFTLGPGDRFARVRCRGCGVEAIHPAPPDDTLRAFYAPAYYGAPARKFVGPVATLVARFQGGRARIARRLLPPHGRVLDVGCGNGGFLCQLASRGYRVEGTEWTAESAARVPAEVRVHVGDLLTLDLPDGAYDLVSIWHVLEHVRRPAETLARAHALLRPGGALLLAMPNAASWQARVFDDAWFHHDPPRHLFGFSPASLLPLLRRQGFAIERTGTLSLEQNPFGVAQSIANRLGFPRDRMYELLKGSHPGGAGSRIVDAALLAATAVPALLFSLCEAAAGAGGTLVVQARRPATGAGRVEAPAAVGYHSAARDGADAV